MKNTMRRRFAASGVSLAAAIALVVGGFAVSANAADESAQPSIEAVTPDPVTVVPDVASPDPVGDTNSNGSDSAPSGTDATGSVPANTGSTAGEAASGSTSGTVTTDPDPADTNADADLPVGDTNSNGSDSAPSGTDATGSVPAEEKPSGVESLEAKPAGPALVENTAEVLAPVATIENFSAEAICVEVGFGAGARVSADVRVPEGAAPVVVQFTTTRLSDGTIGAFSDPRTFATSGTLSKVNTMSDGSYSIGVEVDGVEVDSASIEVTESLCDPEPTPVATVENFSAEAACVDSTQGPLPGALIRADVVVPEGASSVVATVSTGDQVLGSDSFDVSGQLELDSSLPPGDYVIYVSLDNGAIASANVSVSADLCDDPTPTPTPTPEPTNPPTPNPTPTTAPVLPIVTDDDGGSTPPFKSVSDNSGIQSLPNTGASPATPLGFALAMLFVGGIAIAVRLLRRKVHAAK